MVHQWLWDSYDHLVALILANIAMFVVTMLCVYTWVMGTLRALGDATPGVTVMALAAGAWVVLTVVLTLWICLYGHVAPLIARERQLGLMDFLRGFRTLGARALRFSVVVVGVGLVLTVAFWFYAISGYMPAHLRLVGMGLAGLIFWLLLGWVAVSLCAAAWLVRGGLGARAALRRGALLLLARPGLALGVVIHLVLIWAVSLGFKLIGAFLFSFSLTATFLNSLYDVVEAEANPEEELPDPETAKSWKEREELEKERERRRLDSFRYGRTMKDILKPWEG
jgi:hypothetical protein